MRQFALIALFALTLATPAFAQAESPKLTEVEQLKIQIANLQIALRDEQTNSAKWIQSYGTCQVALLGNTSGISDMLFKLEQGIEKNHEGFDFDLKSGTFKPKKVEEPVEKK